MKLKYKKLHEKAITPSYANDTDAGLDLYASSIDAKQYRKFVYGTGIAIEIPEGHVGLLFPRSSVHKYSIRLSNCVGVIDSGYRGEIKFVFDSMPELNMHRYKVGDRIGQLIVIPFPKLELNEVAKLSESDRGDKGFGSSGE